MKNSDVIEKYKTAGQGPCVTHVMDLHEGVIGTSNMPSLAAYVKRMNTLHKHYASLKRWQEDQVRSWSLLYFWMKNSIFLLKDLHMDLCSHGCVHLELLLQKCKALRNLTLSWGKKPTNMKSSVMLCKNKCLSYNNKYLVWVNTKRE